MERLLLKKLYTAISMISAFIFVFLFLIMILLGSTSAAGSANAITLQNILSSDEGNQVYTDYFRPAIDEVYTKSNIMIELSWIMTPYLYTDFNKFDKEEISKIAWLCVAGHNILLPALQSDVPLLLKKHSILLLLLLFIRKSLCYNKSAKYIQRGSSFLHSD